MICFQNVLISTLKCNYMAMKYKILSRVHEALKYQSGFFSANKLGNIFSCDQTEYFARVSEELFLQMPVF